MEILILVVGGDSDSGFGSFIGFIVGLVCVAFYAAVAGAQLRVMQLAWEILTQYSMNLYIVLGFAVCTLIMSFFKYRMYNTYIITAALAIGALILSIIYPGNAITGWTFTGLDFSFSGALRLIGGMVEASFLGFVYFNPLIRFLEAVCTLPLAIISKKHRVNLCYSCVLVGYFGVGMMGEALQRWLNLIRAEDFTLNTLMGRRIDSINFILDGMEPVPMAIVGAIPIIIATIAFKKLANAYFD